MVTQFTCLHCGNSDTQKVHQYDGAVGYEALICKECGIYCDSAGWHERDEWSNQFLTKEKEPYCTCPECGSYQLKTNTVCRYPNCNTVLPK